MRHLLALPAALVLACLATSPAAGTTGFEPGATPSLFVTGAPSSAPTSLELAFRVPGLPHRGARRKQDGASPDPTVFSAQRAAVILRSLTVPGWGQATMGRRHAAGFFATAELGIWTAFTSFRVQEKLRTDTYVSTARLFAGIDLSGRDEEYRRLVGAFSSSDEYNQRVVAYDAANLFLQNVYNPDMAGYRAYVDAHSLKGNDAWSWNDYASFKRYGDERKQAQRAAMRANTALAIAVANRIASALHAARVAGHVRPATEHTSWNVGFAPGDPAERVLFRSGVSVRF